MTAANLLTLLRIALVPIFGWLWAGGRHVDALVVFAIAGVSDALDGLLARWLHQPTRLGAILDPAADKLIVAVSFFVAASTGAVPVWLAVVVIGRDVLLAAGVGLVALRFRSRGLSLRIHPTRLGKYSTFLQLATIVLALVWRITEFAPLRLWLAACVYLAGLFTIVAGAQYVLGAVLALAGVPARALPWARGATSPRSAP